jgi:transglutaminase-like putative cysteine protease
MIVAEWAAGELPRILEVVAVVSTRNYQVALDAPMSRPKPLTNTQYLKGTSLIAVDGIVRDTAVEITSGRRTDLTKARAIYDWIVDTTLRDPTVRGCGVGDIRWMLETKTYAGKCADLNALFVGLARAAGLPARDVYGVRVAPSAEFSSLGRSGGNVTTAQHCRAEVYLSEFGWVPVDPADVAKVRLEERANGPLGDPHLERARERLFGAWEMNWVAYNDGHDVRLPGSMGRPVPFFMYPQAEIDAHASTASMLNGSATKLLRTSVEPGPLFPVCSFVRTRGTLFALDLVEVLVTTITQSNATSTTPTEDSTRSVKKADAAPTARDVAEE